MPKPKPNQNPSVPFAHRKPIEHAIFYAYLGPGIPPMVARQPSRYSRVFDTDKSLLACYSPKHWEYVGRVDSDSENPTWDYWVSGGDELDHGFKALTPEARAWAEEHPVQI